MEEEKEEGKTGGKKTGEEKAPGKEAEGSAERKTAAEEKAEPPEEVETILDADRAEPEAGGDKELSEEELRRLVEESLEKVTVADIVLNMMNQLASVGYLKMGLPESVNVKYRNLEQARLAIDTLEAMLKGCEGKVSEEALKPFKGTLANLQLNFVQLK